MIIRYIIVTLLVFIGHGTITQGQTVQNQTDQNQIVYVTDQIRVGLHTEKSLQSPIIKLVSSGTRLELVKRESDLSYVSDPTGTGGWVDSSYVSEFTSADPKIQEAENRIRSLETSLNNARQGQTSAEIDNLMQQIEAQSSRIQQLTGENESLNQQIISNNADSLYEKIEQLSLYNRQLESQLANVLESAPLPPQDRDTASGDSYLTLKNIFIVAAIIMVIGIGLGIYIMDLVNRKRHGGFRI